TGGTGLGLAIVESIVAAHDGHVKVSDTPGGGATFEIYLPLVISKPPADALEGEPSTDTSDEADPATEKATKPRAKGKSKAKTRGAVAKSSRGKPDHRGHDRESDSASASANAKQQADQLESRDEE